MGANFRNKNYHEATDTIGTINKTFMTNVLKATIATLVNLAELDHSGSDSKVFDTSVATKEAFNDCDFQIMPNPANQRYLFNWAFVRDSKVRWKLWI